MVRSRFCLAKMNVKSSELVVFYQAINLEASARVSNNVLIRFALK